MRKHGDQCSVVLVADLMREASLRACQQRAPKRTTLPGEEPVTRPDMIDRDFTAEAPGTRLVGDITCLKTNEGWLYMAKVIELATRMVTGWQLVTHMPISLVTDALTMALTHGHVKPGAIFQATAAPSLGSRGRRVRRRARHHHRRGKDRGVLGLPPESFFAALKNEMYLPPVVRHPVPRPVHCRRVHQGLLQPSPLAFRPPGYRTPFEALTDYQTAPSLHDQQPEELPKFLIQTTSGKGVSPGHTWPRRASLYCQRLGPACGASRRPAQLTGEGAAASCKPLGRRAGTSHPPDSPVRRPRRPHRPFTPTCVAGSR